MNKKVSYIEAFEELQAIVAEIEKGQIGIDELALQVKRATELINICEAKLTETEDNVQKILQNTNPENSKAPVPSQET